MGFVAKLTELSGRVWKSYRTHKTPRAGDNVVQNSQTLPRISTKVYPIPGYGYEVRTDLTELPGKGMKVLKHPQNCRLRV